MLGKPPQRFFARLRESTVKSYALKAVFRYYCFAFANDDAINCNFDFQSPTRTSASLSQSVQVKTASEMTYIVSSGALNSTQTPKFRCKN